MATRRPKPPTPAPVLPVEPSSSGSLGVAVGTALGGGTFLAGSGGTAMLGMATATTATKKLVDNATAALRATLRSIAVLRIARQREALRKAGFADDVIAGAMKRENELEAIFQRRSAERMRIALGLALRAPDASARSAAIESATRREQNYARQRALASGARLFASVERAALEGQSPSGAFWKLGVAAEHTPDCEAMAGKFWPWEVLRRIHPLLHPGCKCKLLSYGEALAAGLLVPSAILSLDDARRLAEPVIAYVEREHAQENEALAELLVRAELALVEGADLDFLAVSPIAGDDEIRESYVEVDHPRGPDGRWIPIESAIRDVVAKLGIRRPVVIETGGLNSVERGRREFARRTVEGKEQKVHLIRIPKSVSPVSASKTIHHELEHARQHDEVDQLRAEDPGAADRLHQRYFGNSDYISSATEVSARNAEQRHRVVPLATIPPEQKLMVNPDAEDRLKKMEGEIRKTMKRQ